MDSLAASMLTGVLQNYAPAWLEPWAILCNPQHPLCGWPDDQAKLFTQHMKAGGVLAALVGHSSPDSLVRHALRR